MKARLTSLAYAHDVGLDDLTLDRTSCNDLVAAGSRILDRHGIVVVRGFYDRDKAKTLGQRLAEIVGAARTNLQDQSFYACDAYYAQVALQRFKNYQELASADKPVINIRSLDPKAPDRGFVDVFFIERLAAGVDAFSNCAEALRSDEVQAMVAAVSNFAGRHMNLYLNQSVTNTRGPHIDNIQRTYKCFMYLSDVPDERFGPYTYVPGSHRGSLIKKLIGRINRLQGRSVTDMPIAPSQVLKLLGDAGTLIISCQSGIHGGWPQRAGEERVMLVDSYH